MNLEEFQNRISTCSVCKLPTKLVLEFSINGGGIEWCNLLYEKDPNSDAFIKKGFSRINKAYEENALRYNSVSPDKLYITSSAGIVFTSTSFLIRESDKIHSLIYKMTCCRNPDHFVIISNRITNFRFSHDIGLLYENLDFHDCSVINNHVKHETSVKLPGKGWLPLPILIPIDSWPTDSIEKFESRINTIMLLK